MYADDRIAPAHWLVAGLAAMGLHALLLLALTSSDLVRIGEPQGRAATASRLRIALGTAAAKPASRPAPAPPPIAKARPKASPRHSSGAERPPPAPPRIETANPSRADVAAGPMAAGPIAARVGDTLGAEPRSEIETSPHGAIRSEYFSALHARVQGALDYPRRARLDGVEGTVVLHLRIDRDGRIQGSHVVESSGSRVLDRHAVRIAKRAAPFGRVPTHFEVADLAFELPVEFALSD